MSGLPIISADERLAERRGIKGGDLRQIRNRQDLVALDPGAQRHVVLRPRGRRPRHRGLGRRHHPAALDCYQTVFIDWITVAGRLCFQWCKGQPQAVADRSGKPDLRGAYGLHGQEMIAWLTHLQHTRDKNV